MIVRNPTSVVERYHVELVGLAARWAAPGGSIELSPGECGLIPVTVRVPAAADTGQGSRVLGVRVIASGGTVAAAEFELSVLPVEVALEVRSRNAVAYFTTRHHVVVRNLGREEALVWVGAEDPEERLRLEVWPELVAVPAGGVVSVVVRGHPAGSRRRLRGEPVRAVVIADPHSAPLSSVEITCRFRGIPKRRAPQAVAVGTPVATS